MSLPSSDWQTYKGTFHDLWRNWWGKAERKAELDAEEVVTCDGLLDRTKGKLFVRQHYLDVYQRLEELPTIKKVCGGVVLSGQPGTGKTYSLYFFLLKKLISGESVLFRPTSSVALYFSPEGVQQASGDLPETSVEDIPDSTWALINTDEGDYREPPSSLTWQIRLFIVQATSPHRSRYKAWVKQNRGTIWSTKPWTREELPKVLVLEPGVAKIAKDQRQLPILIDLAIRRWGWAPRDIGNLKATIAPG